MNEKKLYRVRNGSMIAGVCNGLGAYLNLDPNIIRIICVAGCCVGGFPIVAYILAAVFLPEVPSYQDADDNASFTDITPDNNSADMSENGKDII